MNLQENVRAHPVNVGSPLVAGPFALGKRPVDKRRPYTRLPGPGSAATLYRRGVPRESAVRTNLRPLVT